MYRRYTAGNLTVHIRHSMLDAMMSASDEWCSLCENEIGEGDVVIIGDKGAKGINQASIARGDSIIVLTGTRVHKKCRINYINKKSIELFVKANRSPVKTLKRSVRVSTGLCDSKTHCLYCGNEVVIGNAENSCVRTDTFVQSILSHCTKRNDDWAFAVQGRIEYFGRDLHAADCVYHRSCDKHFRANRDIPVQHRADDSIKNKQRKVGRPKNIDQEQAFLKMCSFLEENDEEQLTISCLASKMAEYLEEKESVAFGNQYLKGRLLKQYGGNIFISESDGLHDIVTLREKTSQILRNYFSTPKVEDGEQQKRAIIETAARLIKSDLKSKISRLTDEYPKASEIDLQSALDYIPMSLRFFLQQLFVGKDTCRKEASIGHAIVQAVRPRAVIAPLQLGLAVQMHHHFRSRFLIDSLYAMGFSSAYSEVQRFEENAAASIAPAILGGQIGISDKTLLFVADNVDHNIITLDGKGTFHGMGMIAAVTPGSKVSHIIPRRMRSDLRLVDLTRIDITEYRFSTRGHRKIKFQSLPTPETHDHKIDILWELSFRFKQPVPNWQGMMYSLHKNREHPGKSSLTFLPMIDMYPGDKTCILSTLEYLCKLASECGSPAIVTFDQPLYWKASEIKQEVSEDNPVRGIVLLLGSFHTLMNLLGAVGKLMDGTGMKDIMGTIYGENAVLHIMSGKAVQRALRGHLLIDQCLTQQVADRIISDQPEFKNLLQELENLYYKTEMGECDYNSLCQSECLKEIACVLSTERDTLSSRSDTSKLWLTYQQMIGIARELIEADRTGSWKMHLHAVASCLPVFAAAGHANYLKSAYLYLQSMLKLETENPFVFHRFMDGLHVIRRSEKFWAGLGCDLVIEQSLMRSLKSTGGLTRGSGMTEHQRALWTMSSPVSSSYNEAMQDLTRHTFTTSEQHKETTASRINRDHTDLTKISGKLQAYSPFSEESSLRNIISGVNATKDVNVHNLFTFGKNTVKTMEGQDVFSFSYKRKMMKAKTMASAGEIEVAEDRSIDPGLLFQRFLVVSQSGDLSLDEVMGHELSPYPLSLFEGKNQLRQPDKARLCCALKEHLTNHCNGAGLLESVSDVEHYVLDGGSLLHRLKWTEGNTYSSIADEYATFTVTHYGNATVVFDGYSGRPTTKDYTHHRRRKKKIGNRVNIGHATILIGNKEDFLSNEANKQDFIRLVSERMRERGCFVMQAEGDADVDIVKAAVSTGLFRTTVLIGEDTDLLVLLLHCTPTDTDKNIYFRSDKGKATIVYDIKIIKQILGKDFCQSLLFLHAFTGCDTTSSIFGIGKKSVFLKMVKGDAVLQSCAGVFSVPKQDPVVIENIGCEAMIALFNGKPGDSLHALRYNILCKKVSAAKNFVTPERLPPTASATKFHSLRSYLQIMHWMGLAESMEAVEWGWNCQENSYIPVMMDTKPAPEALLTMIHCNCSTGCGTLRCSCRKQGLDCSQACGRCQNGNCDNMNKEAIPYDEQEDETEI